MRNSRASAYKDFIEKILSHPQYDLPCESYLLKWKLHLLKKVEEAPNLAAFSAAFYKGWTCGQCNQDLVSDNRSRFETFITSRAVEESTLPELR